MLPVLRFWESRQASNAYRTGVSLHSHTLYSRENLSFLGNCFKRAPLLSGLRDWDQKPYFWWTPPLTPRQAWELETRQLEEKLGVQALVSITDHDSIEAGLRLGVLEQTRDVPVSVEWTAPYGHTFFHIGVHNIPRDDVRRLFADMQEYRRSPVPGRVRELLSELASYPDVLIVLNHPMWDEAGIGPVHYKKVLLQFLAEHRDWIHALEWNGFRSWSENALTEQLCAELDFPLISGGDRHGREPNALVNLTNAATFPEFVDEVRRDRLSQVLMMPQLRRNRSLRIAQVVRDVFRDEPEHDLGWIRWADRVFYLDRKGSTRRLSAIWGGLPSPAAGAEFSEEEAGV